MDRTGDKEAQHPKEGVGSLSGKAWFVLLTLVLVMEDPVGQRELDPGVVELLDLPISGQALVLSVHAVGATVGVLAQPDARVLHLKRGIIKHLPAGDDFP